MQPDNVSNNFVRSSNFTPLVSNSVTETDYAIERQALLTIIASLIGENNVLKQENREFKHNLKLDQPKTNIKAQEEPGHLKQSQYLVDYYGMRNDSKDAPEARVDNVSLPNPGAKYGRPIKIMFLRGCVFFS